ncbi:hypothetical protein CKO25_09300 [Thiocapsa imhoffii]|uniref:Carrier domain-containing protein n=1 Tax=Thiocapsa imhoffii TaxID=382777 RepID=A0A9X1B994_9GAMM|nr:non-ribosomal peptide synthetase [Thiocapsa imhoffii]MBK1644840.1 hypothetical protein [Thiocapsa imhoffii]
MDARHVNCTAPPAKTIYSLFDSAVDRSADHIALVHAVPGASRSWTYRALRQAVEAASARFAGEGVLPGDIVAVIADRQLETIAAYLAAMRLGAAYLPIDPRFPIDRIRYMLSDAEPRLVLAERAVAGLETRALIESAAAADAVKMHEQSPLKVPEDDPERAACIMYTSGSTGAPKGVVLPHRSLVRLLWGADYYDFGADRVFLQLSALTFDVSILEIFGALVHGGTSVLFPTHGVPDLELLRAVVRDHGVTTTWLTTSLFNSIVSLDPSVLQGLHTILIGGEALSAPHVRLAQRALPELQLINGYGPTENHISTCYQIPNPLPQEWASIPIGRPITGSTAYVLDEQGAPVAAGQVGELYVGGYGVALGYLNKPELTAERFLPDPFIEMPGLRMYKTGDLVRDLGDGCLDYLGRNDTQVKIRGHRIELGEIENVLLSHPQVTDAKVRLKHDGHGEKHLVAYYLTDGVDLTDLGDWLSRKLPAAMVPSQIVRLAYIPLNQNGKLDESRLPNPFDTDPSDQVEGTGSILEASLNWASVPELIEALWRLVLPPGQGFSHTDSFFQVGGTSLGTLQVAARLSRELDRPIPVIKLFEFPTIERLAAYLSGADASRPLDAAQDRAARARQARERRRGTR